MNYLEFGRKTNCNDNSRLQMYTLFRKKYMSSSPTMVKPYTSNLICRYNLRKLSELPHHLLRSSRYEDLYDECLFNYDFLRAKIASMPLQLTLADFEELQEKVFDKDTKILADTLRLVFSQRPALNAPAEW